jgi:hypothetical protein
MKQFKSEEGRTGMKKFTTFAFLIGLGFSVSLHPSLAQSTGTADDLVKRVVSALAANDQPALSKLGIDQSEFKKYVWPTLAAQMSGSNTEFVEKRFGCSLLVRQPTRFQAPTAARARRIFSRTRPPQIS